MKLANRIFFCTTLLTTSTILLFLGKTLPSALALTPVQIKSSNAENPKQQVAINPLSVEQIKKIAQQQQATLIQYSIISEADKQSELYMWVIKPDGEIVFRRVNLKNISLKNLIAQSRESLGVKYVNYIKINSTQKNNLLKGLFKIAPLKKENPNKNLQQLYQILIQPIAEHLPTNPENPIIFIPQGELFLVPFAALRDTNNKYLIEKHTILSAPSIQVLDLTYKRKKSLAGVAKDILVVGNPTSPQKLSPLPGAEEEAKNIARLLNIKPLIGNAATETEVIQKLPQAKIIHLATYALRKNSTGKDTGVIVLAGSNKDDGLLTAAEIQKLRLNAELVVLSGGNTALGKITGDGVIGLQRSFLSAGVPNVISSLWCPPDKPTAKLMTEFYRQYRVNNNPAQALRQSMLKMMKDNPNPKSWAAFTLTGTAK